MVLLLQKKMDKLTVITLVLISILFGVMLGHQFWPKETEISVPIVMTKYVPTTIIKEVKVFEVTADLNACLKKIQESDNFKRELWGLK